MEGATDCALTPIGEATSKSCERCRRRKIKCDRRQPCLRCCKANVECHRSGSGEKQRPVSRSYVQALEGQIATLELFIRRLSAASGENRDLLLAGLELDSTGSINTDQVQNAPKSETTTAEAELVFARARTGKLRKSRAGNSSQFYGPTSLYQLQRTAGIDEPESSMTSTSQLVYQAQAENQVIFEEVSPRTGLFPDAPHDEVPQSLMATFFKEQYPYNMFIYREFFLRDYDIGAGPYYSELLFYAICATGALASEDPLRRNLSTTFSSQAQALLYPSLDSPDITTLQALILLGRLEIGNGRPSKGWLFCGMAFRLAHEMGLHLDPNNWKGTNDPQIDMEIRRRIYWAAFSVDKQLSLYFGRPPALYPNESDVRNTIRIPYPSDWEGLLDTYIAKGTSITAYEDGIALAGTFIYRVELSKIMHTMITELFENRRKNANGTLLANTARQIHVALTKWLSDLPGKLHWNQWSIGQVPAYTLHLHMLFHTTMIILHRPPRHLLHTSSDSTTEDLEICHESLRAILKLMKTYSRYYCYRSLPLDFVHTLSTAAGILLMQRDTGHSIDDCNISKSLESILSAMNDIEQTWPCVSELRTSILEELQRTPDFGNSSSEPVENNIMTATLDPFGTLWDGVPQFNHDDAADDLGPLITDDLLTGQFSWDENTMT